jgi:hypothetical protein
VAGMRVGQDMSEARVGIKSGGCPVKGLVLCHVRGAGVAVRELSVALVKME